MILQPILFVGLLSLVASRQSEGKLGGAVHLREGLIDFKDVVSQLMNYKNDGGLKEVVLEIPKVIEAKDVPQLSLQLIRNIFEGRSMEEADADDGSKVRVKFLPEDADKFIFDLPETIQVKAMSFQLPAELSATKFNLALNYLKQQLHAAATGQKVKIKSRMSNEELCPMSVTDCPEALRRLARRFRLNYPGPFRTNLEDGKWQRILHNYQVLLKREPDDAEKMMFENLLNVRQKIAAEDARGIRVPLSQNWLIVASTLIGVFLVLVGIAFGTMFWSGRRWLTSWFEEEEEESVQISMTSSKETLAKNKPQQESRWAWKRMGRSA